MARTRSLLVLLGPLAIGGMVAALWFALVGGRPLLNALRTAHPAGIVGMAFATTVWFFLRFLRSQFLLRRAGVRIPIRPALATYLAALPGTATPAYVGEAIRSVFLRRRFGAPLGATLYVLVLERLMDVAALAMIALAVDGAGARRIGGLFLFASVLALPLLHRIGQRTVLAKGDLSRLFGPVVLVIGLGASLLAWLIAAALYPLGALSLGVALRPADGAAVFTGSTLLGAVTLSPAGAGVTGSLAILQLRELGLPLGSAVSVVTLVRLTSVGLAMATGVAFLWRELRHRSPNSGDPAHFDTIATEYSAQWSPHVWDLLLDRKLSLMVAALPSPPKAAGIGLDLGCGLAIQAGEMGRRGYRVIGMEPSIGLLSRRPDRTAPVIGGDALRLPFATRSLDFVYAIGVLHHLPGRDEQAQAVAEIRRVLRPGGLLLVHESNPRNPFFRFYMGYLFPILKSIDEGTEWWIDPRDWGASRGFRLEAMRYFTFLPDFTPRILMKPALAVERWLERGPTAPFSAHYLAVLRRQQD